MINTVRRVGRVSESRLAGFVRGLGLPIRGAVIILSHRGLKRYAILPLAVNLVLYALAAGIFVHLLWRWQFEPAAWDFWGPIGRWLSVAANRLDWLLKLAGAILALAVAFITFTNVGMALASPFNDLLSERVEAARGGREWLAPDAAFFGSTLRSVGHSLLNLILQLLAVLSALPFLLIPVIGFIPLLLVGGWFAGFAFFDVPMTRNAFRLRHKRLAVSRHFWKILGLGLAMQICFAVPLLGLLLLPVGVAAGTLAFGDEDWDAVLSAAGSDLPDGTRQAKN